ncbi:hypothetical protein V6N12_050347 [Hibiscus sabdariffa]|uniref:PB1-like domain-containing protein n=1 Tax=Hibiscus sabdariffa TaxID=183260 RepID=A0ABR2GC68_9ROSI
MRSKAGNQKLLKRLQVHTALEAEGKKFWGKSEWSIEDWFSENQKGLLRKDHFEFEKMIGGMLREQGDNDIQYSHDSENFTCVIHYDGEFIFNDTTMEYNSSSVAYFDYVDCVHFSTFEICHMVERLGLVGAFGLSWSVPFASLSNEFVMPLKTNSDCMALVNSLSRDRYIHVYLEEMQNIVEQCNEYDDREDAVEVEDVVEDEVDEEVEDEEEENIEEFEVSDVEFGFDDEGLQDENIGIEIRVQRQMDGFGPEVVRVNPELESDSDKSDELNSD